LILDLLVHPQTYDPTIEDFYQKQLFVDNGLCVVEVIDTAGQGGLVRHVIPSPRCLTPIQKNMRPSGTSGFGEFNAIDAKYFNHLPSEGQGFLLVYSIASRPTFAQIETLHRSILRVGNPVLMLVGNKADRLEREVSKDEGVALARRFGCEYVETSARTGKNVEHVFIHLIRSLRQKRNKQSPSPRKGEKKLSRCIIF
jgi:GTPase KRas protein